MARTKKVKIYRELEGALRDALAYEKGEEVNLRFVELPVPPTKVKPSEIKQIRQSLHANQVLFAKALNVSPNAVRSWEQGTRHPNGAALKLLVIARKNPRVLLQF